MHYSYIKKILLIVFSTLILFSIINFFVDPEQVYPKLFRIDNDKQVLSNFSKELALSKYGILNRYSDETWRHDLNDRDRMVKATWK